MATQMGVDDDEAAEEGITPEQAAADPDENATITALIGMSDEQLMETFGLDAQLQQIKENLSDLDTLKGPAREDAENRLREMLTPSVSPSSLRYLKEDLDYKYKKKSAKEEMANSSPTPSSVL